MRAPPLRLLLLVVLLSVSCIHRPEERCDHCYVIDRVHPYLRPLKPNTRKLFVLVPGALGYGWEWDHAVDKLRSTPDVDFIVFWWNPWASLRRSAEELRDRMHTTFRQLPLSVTEIDIVAHSAAGLIAAHGVADLVVPSHVRTRLITIGAPFAGMMGPPMSLDDPLDSPFLIGLLGSFRDYPPSARDVEVIEYVTSARTDPVMARRWCHDAAPVDIGPAGRRRILLGDELDHNFTVAHVIDQLLAAP